METVQVADVQQILFFHSRLSNRSLLQTYRNYYSLHGNTLMLRFLLVPKHFFIHDNHEQRSDIQHSQHSQGKLPKSKPSTILLICVYFECSQCLFHNVGRKRCISRSSRPTSKACNFIKKETLAQVFSCEFCEISKNTFFKEHLWATASVYQKTDQSEGIMIHLLNDVLN